MDKVNDKDHERKNRKRIIILTVSILLLTVLIVGAVVGTCTDQNQKKHDSYAFPSSKTVKSICSVTQYPGSCYASLESSNSTNPETIFQISLRAVMDSLNKVMKSFPGEYVNRTQDPMVKEALSVCDTVLDDAVYALSESISETSDAKKVSVDDLKTWLSTIVTDQETCLDAVEEVNATFVEDLRSLLKNSTEYASNSLAIVSEIIGVVRDFVDENVPQVHGRRRRRRLLGDFPTWVAHGDRRLLQEDRPKPNLKVAADGSGNVKTLAAAVAKIPQKSKKRFVIYVKAGVYKENVVLGKNHWNVLIYGDGKRKTIISGSKNYVDGTPTFKTATFGVAGKGFMARDIGFRNTAGPQKHQAVAFRSGSDQSVCYRCSFDGFQDTLYVHSNRQFYRECDITGTVDFIFGNSAVVLQNCNIWPRQPMNKQLVTITAQGKKDRNQNTGISIQRCAMRPLGSNLTAKTYLGRPWKDYSTAVVMQSSISGFLDPRGWVSWVKNKDPPRSIFYAEHENTGPGSNTINRVKWAGYKPKLTRAQASKFNVGPFIQGRSWLPAMAVAFDSN